MESDKGRKTLRGVYLIPDPLMMKPHFGPSEHIRVGIQELKKYFDIEILILGEYKATEHNDSKKTFITKGVGTANGFLGSLRDIKLLYSSNRNLSDVKQQLQKLKVDFVYERGQYLDLRGVRAAKELGIHHFYEVNWLNFHGIRQFYKSWFNGISKRIEEWSYKRSSLNFFVGPQHKLIDIPDEKVFIIQNGIHQSLIESNRHHINCVNGKIKVCFVANLMPHHRFEVFSRALHIAGIGNEIELHLVGYNFQTAVATLPGNIQYVNHGPKNKEQMASILKQCNVGIISGGTSYSSFMKLFEYAAFKLCVICPRLENVQFMFSETEVFYFSDEDSQSMADNLSEICKNKERIPYYGENIFSKVMDQFTWERIYQGSVG